MKFNVVHFNDQTIYEAICKVLSAGTDQVVWKAFSEEGWQSFIRRAQRERVGPLVYWKLQEAKVDIPPDILNQLRLIYYQNLAQNEILFQELNRILETFTKAKIPVILLKGAALAKTVYPSIALRPMNDIDLMVPPSRLLDAIRIFKNKGYIQEKITYHAVMRGGPGNQVVMEIHWAIIPNQTQGKTAALDWFWENTQLIQDSSFVRVFTPEAQLLYLVGHLMMQSQAEEMGLLWFYDLYLLISSFCEHIDLNRLWRTAEWLGWERALNVAFRRVEECFGLITSAWHDFSKDNARSFDDLHLLSGGIIKSAISLLDFKTRVIVFIGLLFPAPAYMRWRYKPNPTWLWIFYYSKRWWDILVDQFF